MGNSRLGLLDMILNAWLFKLNHTKRESRVKPKESLHPNTTPNQSFTPNRASYYYPSTATSTEKHTNFPSHLKASGAQFSNSPRKLVTTSISNLCIQTDDLQQANVTTNAIADITNKVNCQTSIELKDFVVVSDLKLPPILIGKGRYSNNPTERSPVGFHRLRMRVGSTPRFTVKKVQVQKGRRSSGSPRARKRLSESFAIVKSSYDPEKDFKESMMEMIVEKNIRAAKDLEELLARYLMLNSNEYHDVIVKVFTQIWFDFSDFIKL